MAYCTNCGQSVRSGSNFCEGCGTPLASATKPDNTPVTGAVEGSRPGSASDCGAATRDRAKNAARAGAVVTLVGFFLPWVTCQGLMGPQTASGIELAGRGATGLWVIPVCMLIAVGVLLNKGKSLQERATAAKVVVGSSLASIVVLFYYWVTFNGAVQKDEFGLGTAVRQTFSIQIGAVLSFLGSIGTGIAGFLHLQSGASVAEGQASLSSQANSTLGGGTA